MAETLSKSPDSDKTGGNDAPTQAPGGGDATLPLQPGMAPGSPLAAAGGPATCLGPYELIEMVGRGGMGTVWKARHTKLDKMVALKLLPPHLMSDADAVSRFEREMKAVGKLEHAHIVRAMDAGQADGIHYLVMEYIEGVDLARLVKNRGPRKMAEACQMIRHAALGLAHAHEHGLVHRDIKPSNLLLSKKGFVKILDLGLARLQGEKAAGEASLTVQGDVMGTPDYMAPEQWQSAHSVGPAADLYALGCTLHFLLTGRAPFATADQTSCTHKMTAHVVQQPPPLPDVPPEVEALYQKLMAKEPERRPASAKELADELRTMIRSWTKSPAQAETIPWVPVVGSTTGTTRRVLPHAANRGWWIAAAVAASLVAFGAFAGWVAFHSKPRSDTSERSHAGRGNEDSVAATSKADITGKTESAAGLQPPLAIAPFDAEQARNFQETWARFLNVPVEYANSLGMKFRLIPPGEYERGTPVERAEPNLELHRKWADSRSLSPGWRSAYERGLRNEAPRHHVRIVHPFYLAVCEVTQGQFQQMMKQNRCYFGPNGAGHDRVDDSERAKLPVESVTFEEAVEFCRRLSERESPALAGDSGSPNRYRLPTDAEWENACRAGTTAPFWFGGPSQDMSALVRCAETTPLPVGRLKANPYGLFDMYGNVWELCHDYFVDDEFAHFSSGMAESPTGPASGMSHVARGGSFDAPGIHCRSASRMPAPRPAPFIGFRPVLEVGAVRGAAGGNK
jgi:serine/threonine protein kinase